jgi:hypothetical protein
MNDPLFPTITGVHWRKFFIRRRDEMWQDAIARGRDEGLGILGQIRAKVAELRANRNLQGSSAVERLTHNQEASGSTPLPAPILTAAGRSADTGRLGDHRIQGNESAHAHAGSGESF